MRDFDYFRALVTYAIGSTIVMTLCCMAGLSIYAHYSECDPYTQGYIIFRDEVSSKSRIFFFFFFFFFFEFSKNVRCGL